MNSINKNPFAVIVGLLAMATMLLVEASCTDSTVKSDHAAAKPFSQQRRMASENGASSPSGSNPDLEPTMYLEQNWSPAERTEFYRTPQGSHIMPLKFAAALRRPDNSKPFFSNENLAQYGFIPQSMDAVSNPLGLPIGFTIDGGMKFDNILRHSVENGDRMIGVTCALCHTSNFHYKGQAFRIDGGQTLANFQAFVHDMDVALKVTREDQAKLALFLNDASAFERKNADSDYRNQLLTEMDQTLSIRGDWTNLNDLTHYYGHGYNDSSFQHGPGRIDAFDAIFNQVLARDLKDSRNASEANNPVSPPVIWDAPQSDVLQWNGLASNSLDKGGPIARNIGEVLGVFGHIDFQNQTKILDGYCTSARRENLEKIETTVAKLWSPKWPEELLGKLDKEKITLGKQLFEQTCSQCHKEIDRADPGRRIISQLIPLQKVGTDSKFDENALARMANSDLLEGNYTRLKFGRKLEAVEPAVTVLKHAVAGAIAGSISILTCKDSIDVSGMDVLNSWMEVAKKPFEKSPALDADEIADPKQRIAAMTKQLMVYKARPLNGIWSSPPFLHNGSVNSLYELLLPPDQRKNFYIGCDEFDPIRVGLNCTALNGAFLFDTSINGNLPKGHDFGPRGENSEAARMAIVEYLKSL